MSLSTSRRLVLMLSKLALGVRGRLSILDEFLYDCISTLSARQGVIWF